MSYSLKRSIFIVGKDWVDRLIFNIFVSYFNLMLMRPVEHDVQKKSRKAKIKMNPSLK